MVDAVSKPQNFTTIKYTTKDGENITATKKDGIVTLSGDKNGIRQMPLEEFKKELINSLPQVELEKTPAKDTVEISNKQPDTKPTQEKATNVQPNDKSTEPKKLDVAA